MFLSWIHQTDSIVYGFSLILVFLISFRNFWVSTSCQFSYLVACPIEHYWFGFLLTLFLLNEKMSILISSSLCWTVSTFFFWGFTPTFKMIHFETFFILFLYARHFCFWCRYPQKVHIIISFFLYRLCVLGVQLLIILSWAHNQQLLRRDQLFGFIDQLISNPLVFFVLVLTASFLSHACVYS